MIKPNEGPYAHDPALCCSPRLNLRLPIGSFISHGEVCASAGDPCRGWYFSLGALHQSEPIDDFLLHLVHDPAWVAVVRNGTWEKQAARRVGLPWSPGLAKRTFLAVGTWRTVELAWQDGLAGHLAGGLIMHLPISAQDTACLMISLLPQKPFALHISNPTYRYYRL